MVANLDDALDGHLSPEVECVEFGCALKRKCPIAGRGRGGQVLGPATSDPMLRSPATFEMIGSTFRRQVRPPRRDQVTTPRHLGSTSGRSTCLLRRASHSSAMDSSSV